MLGYSADRSSKKNGTNASPLKTDKLPNYETNLNSYISACQEDPELKSFDSSLYARTSKLIASLSAGEGQTGNLSLDSVTEVCGFLHDMSQGVVKIITDSKEDVLKNEELKFLVDLYFEGTTKTLNLFNTVENCVKKAKVSQMNIRIAIKKFEKESMDTDFGGNIFSFFGINFRGNLKKKKKYAETLEELNRIKAMGDPFGDDFADQYESIYKEQLVLLDKFRELQVALDKKKKNVKKARLVNAVFATALVSVLAASMCFCAVSVAGHHVAFTAAMGFIPSASTTTVNVATTGIWVNDLLKDYEKALKNKKGLLQLTENSTKVNIEAMKTIKNLVDKLIISISLILETVEVAVRIKEEETIKLVMQEIIKNVDEFSDKVEEVGEHVAKCSKSVAKGKVLVLEYITNLVSQKRKW